MSWAKIIVQHAPLIYDKQDSANLTETVQA